MAEPGCAAGCGTPMDAVLLHEGWDMHPGCAFPALAVTAQDVTDGVRAIGRRRRERQAWREGRKGRRP